MGVVVMGFFFFFFFSGGGGGGRCGCGCAGFCGFFLSGVGDGGWQMLWAAEKKIKKNKRFKNIKNKIR